MHTSLIAHYYSTLLKALQYYKKVTNSYTYKHAILTKLYICHFSVVFIAWAFNVFVFVRETLRKTFSFQVLNTWTYIFQEFTENYSDFLFVPRISRT